MRRLFITIVLLVSAFFMLGCTAKKEEHIDGINDHRWLVEGEVLEVRDDSIILIEITKQWSEHYDVGDKVFIKYLAFHEWDGLTGNSEEAVPRVGDEVGAGFWEEDVEKDYEDGIDLIPVNSAERDVASVQK